MEKQATKDWLDKFWFFYPKDLCHGKKGAKPKALSALLKLKADEEELARIWRNTEAKIRSDRKIQKVARVDRWPLISTFFNQGYYDADIPTEQEIQREVQRLKCDCGREATHPYKRINCCSYCLVNKHDTEWQSSAKVACKKSVPPMPNETVDQYRKRCKDWVLAQGSKGTERIVEQARQKDEDFP